MNRLLAVFSPDTHARFSASDRRVMGFKARHWIAAKKVREGDELVCYLTGVSRWVGLLRVDGLAYEDATPVFVAGEDPYAVRFAVTPVVWLAGDRGIEIRDDEVWSRLSFTREHAKGSSRWTGALRTSLAPLKVEDGELLAGLLRRSADRSE